MAMQVGGKKGGPMGDINVTPLVDVVLVLLIIFMVVTPMLSSGVDVKLPKAQNTESTQDVGQNLVVSIRNDGAVFVDTKRSSNETLIEDINTAYRSDPSRSLLIKGDRELQWKQVKEIMDIINDGGMHTMLIAAEKKKAL
jgi:biopolymer transport protein TolR